MHGLVSFDYWMHDNEMGAEGEEFDTNVRKLAKAWKSVLKKSDADLGIDAEFTRSGFLPLQPAPLVIGLDTAYMNVIVCRYNNTMTLCNMPPVLDYWYTLRLYLLWLTLVLTNQPSVCGALTPCLASKRSLRILRAR